MEASVTNGRNSNHKQILADIASHFIPSCAPGVGAYTGGMTVASSPDSLDARSTGWWADDHGRVGDGTGRAGARYFSRQSKVRTQSKDCRAGSDSDRNTGRWRHHIARVREPVSGFRACAGRVLPAAASPPGIHGLGVHSPFCNRRRKCFDRPVCGHRTTLMHREEMPFYIPTL